jgi:hypothetical protein
MGDLILNVITWALIILGALAMTFIMWFMVWTIGESK